MNKESKIAVLVCGEYRTFDIAVTHSWNQFKNSPNFKIYFSTWDYSYQGNNLLNIHYKENINNDSIKKYFNKDVYVNVMNLQDEMSKFNIVHDMYLSHGESALPIHLKKILKNVDFNEFDYIVLTRPDLFISDINMDLDYHDDIIYTPMGGVSSDIMMDTFFMGKCSTMINFIDTIILNNSLTHELLKKLDTNKLFKFKEIDLFGVEIIRPNCRNISEPLTLKMLNRKFKEYDMEKELLWNHK